MSAEPRFRVTSCTGYVIHPRSEVGSHGKQSKNGGVPTCWQVLDTAVGFALVAEWSPFSRRSPAYCEARAREHAALLNHWDAGGCVGPSPRIDHRPPSKRPARKRLWRKVKV